jgi:hypothetical protein
MKAKMTMSKQQEVIFRSGRFESIVQSGGAGRDKELRRGEPKGLHGYVRFQYGKLLV